LFLFFTNNLCGEKISVINHTVCSAFQLAVICLQRLF